MVNVADWPISTNFEWQRGYEEINEFERTMVADGIRIAKIFLHNPGRASAPVQGPAHQPTQALEALVRRLPESITLADYEVAIEDMMEKTSHRWAPWYLIPANDKPYGRLATFTILIEVLGKELHLKPRPLDPKVAEMAKQLFD